MADEQTKIFVPDPAPVEMDSVTAEWILRQLSRITGSTTIVETEQKEQNENSDGLRTDLDAHIQNQTNPHVVRHEQLSDVTFPTILHNPHGNMMWKNEWVAGEYKQHDVVRDGSWTMVANKDTNERAGPQPVGAEEYAYAGTSPEGQIVAKQLGVGQRYTFPVTGYVTGYRAYCALGNDYRILVVEDPEGVAAVREIISFTAAASGWLEFSATPRLTLANAPFEVWLMAVEPDPTPDVWVANYNYSTPPNLAVPGAGVCLHANAATDIIRFADVDNDAIDQSANLAGMEAGDIIELQGLRWSVQADPVDTGTYFEFVVAPARQAPTDGVFEFTFETVQATPFTTVVDDDYWLDDARVQGYYKIDDAPIVQTESQYGIDLKVQEATVSADWDVVAYSA